MNFFRFNLNGIIFFNKDINRRPLYKELTTTFFFILSLFVCYVVVGVILRLILQETSIVDPRPIYNAHFHWLKDHLGSIYFLIVVFIGPLLEELAFRYGLTFEKKKIILSILLAILFATTPSIYQMECNVLNLTKVVSLIVLYFVLTKYTTAHFWYKLKGNASIYLSVIVFATLHLHHFTPLTWMQVPYYILYILPVLCIGIGLTVVRLRFGIVYSIVVHMCYNAIITLSHL